MLDDIVGAWKFSRSLITNLSLQFENNKWRNSSNNLDESLATFFNGS